MENEMKKWFQSDEQTEAVSGRLSLIFLALTQIGLYVALMYQRYVLDLPPDYYNDLAIILTFSVLGYWGTCLYLGGVIPTLSFRRAAFIYLFIVLAIAVPHTIVHGWPTGTEWFSRLLVILGVPAVLVGGYTLMAYCGKKRIEKIISSDSDLPSSHKGLDQ
jgi:hypothetical protein